MILAARSALRHHAVLFLLFDWIGDRDHALWKTIFTWGASQTGI